MLVVGLTRGGVPVAFEIAQRLDAPLDIVVVRKLGVPWQPELAIGAVAPGGVRILDQAQIRSVHLSNYYIYALIAKEEAEIEKREAHFRDGRAAISLAGQTVILVDDGAATGATMLAAAEAVRRQHPKKIVIAVPVASRDAHAKFETEVGTCICLATPYPFLAVSNWYESFPQVSDDESKRCCSRLSNQRRNLLFKLQPRDDDERLSVPGGAAQAAATAANNRLFAISTIAK